MYPLPVPVRIRGSFPEIRKKRGNHPLGAVRDDTAAVCCPSCTCSTVLSFARRRRSPQSFPSLPHSRTPFDRPTRLTLRTHTFSSPQHGGHLHDFLVAASSALDRNDEVGHSRIHGPRKCLGRDGHRYSPILRSMYRYLFSPLSICRATFSYRYPVVDIRTSCSGKTI